MTNKPNQNWPKAVKPGRSRPGRLRRRRAERGSIMVQALVVLVGLVALLATLAANEHVTLEAAQNRLRRRRVEIGANAAVQQALCVIQTANQDLVTLQDSWALMGDNGNTAFDLGSGTTFRMQIVDASSLININTVATTTSEQSLLNNLPLTQEEIDGLEDWTSTSTTAKTDGAKDDYYNALTVPYNTKLGTMATLSELLLIKGWTGVDLYGTTNTNGVVPPNGALQDTNGNPAPLISLLTINSGMPNVSATGGALTNVSSGRLTAATFTRAGVNATIAARLVAAGPYTTWAKLLGQPGITTAIASQLLNTLKVSTATRQTGKINVNTASQAVLQSIPNLSTTIASSIVTQQATGYQTFGALATSGGFTAQTLARTADYLGIGSDTWIVRVYAESGGVGQAYEVVIGLRNSLPKVITWDRLPNAGIPAYWKLNMNGSNSATPWADTTTETLQPGDSSQTSAGTSTSGSSGGTTGGGK